MFIRKSKNRSGSISVQIISKQTDKFKVVQTIGSADSEQQIAVLVHRANQEITSLKKQESLFVFEKDSLIESYLSSLENSQIRTIGPELIFGKIYDSIGFNTIEGDLFRHLVIRNASLQYRYFSGIFK